VRHQAITMKLVRSNWVQCVLAEFTNQTENYYYTSILKQNVPCYYNFFVQASFYHVTYIAYRLPLIVCRKDMI